MNRRDAENAEEYGEKVNRRDAENAEEYGEEINRQERQEMQRGRATEKGGKHNSPPFIIQANRC